MIDHVAINVSDYDRSRDFYAKALEPLGYTLLMEPVEGHGGFGREGKPGRAIRGKNLRRGRAADRQRPASIRFCRSARRTP